MIDIHLSSLNRSAGQIQPDLPGVFASTPPRRTARGRDRDTLIILLNPVGSDDALSANRIADLLNAAADRFYKSSGSITSALSEAADYLNSYFTDINKNLYPNKAACTAGLNILVIRGDLFFSACAGSSSCLISRAGGVEHFGLDVNPQPGLGVGRSVQLRFGQSTLHPGDLILFAPGLPDGWNETTLPQTTALGFEEMYKLLVREGGSDVTAGIIRIAPGKGQLIRHRMSLAPAQPTPPLDTTATLARAGMPQSTRTTSPGSVAPQSIVDGDNLKPTKEKNSIARRTLAITAGIKTSWEKYNSHRPAWMKKAGVKAANAWVEGEPQRKKAASGLHLFLARMLPGITEKSPAIPQSTMLFAAIAIPVVVVAVGITIYLRSGRGEQHVINLQVAQYYAGLATKEKTRELQTEYWSQANDWLNKAESYGKTDDSNQLRAQVSAALDSLEGVSRLAMVPALSSSIPKTSRISRVVTRDQDVYLLDAPTGRVSRVTKKNSETYQVDFGFTCGPGGFIGKIVDIATLPPNNIQVQPGISGGAAIIGVDENGNAVYCAPKANPTSRPLPRPKVNWSHIKAITINDGVLYVLDTGTGRVWRYRSGEKDRSYEFSQSPSQFFDLAAQNNGGDYVDLSVSTDDLFLLLKNNQMVHCVYSRVDFKESTCTNPAVYEDMRSGSPQALPLNGLGFSQLAFTELPDSALHILDKNSPALYKFGVQLNLYRVMNIEPAIGYDLPGSKPTAFTVSPEQVVFLVYGDKLYYARMP
jgi:hypothetical protein